MTDDRKPTEEERLKAIWTCPPDIMTAGGTHMESWDTLVWDERKAWCEFWEWPTQIRRVRYFNHRCSEDSKLHFSFSEIKSFGWEVVSCSVVRHGFLWLHEAKVWTFRRKAVWTRHGSEESYCGQRESPFMPEQSHEQDEW